MSSSLPSVPSSATGGKNDDVAASSKSPFAKLSSLDPSKKYTLVFLVSVGTTLLITGASGGRLLKKVKMPPTADPMASTRSSATASSAVASTSKAPIAAAPPPARAVKKGWLARVLKPTSAASTSTPPLSASQIQPLLIPPRQLFADPFSFPSSSSRGRFRILRSWSSNRNDPTAYFLPNSLISSQSTIFSDNVDLEDRLHNDGTLDEPFKRELGFNPALDAFKALTIATAITLSLFSAGIYGLIKWYKVDDLRSLALAISYDLTPNLTGANRPTVPTWAQPTSNANPEPEELDSDQRPNNDDRLTPEETNYWTSFKARLDQEAEEHKARKVQEWQELQEARRRNGLEGE